MTADLMGLMFDAVSDDGALAALPKAIADTLGAISVTLQTHAPDQATMLASHGLDPEIVRLHAAHYWRQDPWAIGYEAAALKRTAVSESFVSDDDMLRSETYVDLLKPHGGQFRCLGFVDDMGGGERVLFGAHRRREDATFDAERIETVQALQPLFAGLVCARRRAERGRGRLAERLADADADAVTLADADGRVAFVNAAARRAFAEGPLRLEGGRLAATHPALARALGRALAAACSGRGGSVLSSGDGALRVAVDPLTTSPQGAPPLAVVRVRDEAARRAATLGAAAAALALTPAERALAGALLQGRALAEHAHARGVSIATARTQMRSLLAKAGAARQAELVVRLKAFAP